MTRKHFELIARTIAQLEFPSRQMSAAYLRGEVATAFAKALAETNGQFDAERFITAATMRSTKIDGRG